MPPNSLGVWARRLQLAGLYVLLGALPFSKAAVEICFGLLLIGWVIERLQPATRFLTVWRSRRLRPILTGLLAYLAICAASIAVSDFPGKSLDGFVSKWLEYLLFLVIVADLGSRPGVAARGLAILAGSGGAVFLLGLWQEQQILAFQPALAVAPAHPIGAYWRMTGPYENPIDLATYLMTTTPILVTWGLSQRGWRRWSLVGLGMLLLACLGRTEALGAWLGLAAGLAAAAWMDRTFRWRALAIMAALGLGAVAVLVATGHATRFSPVDAGTRDRWMMWQAALRMIEDRPLLGHGVNTFMANYLTYWVGGERVPRYAHNCYLQVAAETGLIGLAAFAWLLGALVLRWAAGIKDASAPQRAMLTGVTAGLVAFLVQAGLDTNFYALRQAALFWVLSGFAVGLSEPPGVPPG